MKKIGTGKVEKSQTHLQRVAKKLFICFLIMMFLLTLLSRAADSITIAQVMTQNPKGSTLTFTAEGTGTVISEFNQYVKVMQGLRIDKIYVKDGEKIKKGQVLLKYNEEDIEAAIKGLNREAHKLQIQIQEENFSTTQTAAEEQDKFIFACTQAKEDYKTAKEDLKKAEKNHHLNLLKDKKKLLEEKTEEYKRARLAYEGVRTANDQALLEAMNNLEDAYNGLEDLNNKDHRIGDLLNQYGNNMGKDISKSQSALEDLYRMAYGGDNEYEKHREEAAALELKVTRSEEDLKRAESIYQDAIIKQEGIASAKSSYIEAERAVEDAKRDLSAAMKKENTIFTAANNYVTALISNNTEKKNTSLEDIQKGIYGANGYEDHKKEILEAEKKVNRAQINKNTVSEKNDSTLAAEEEKLEQLQTDINNLNNGTYDFEEAAAKGESEIQTAKEKVKAAAAALKTAQFNLKQAVLQEKNNSLQKSKELEAARLRQEALKIDLDEKSENMNQLETLKAHNGKVKAVVSGMVDDITLVAGKQAETDNTIAISTGDYGILAIIPREQGDYISIGDKMELTQKGKKDKITVKVRGVRFVKDEQGNEQTEVTASLPKGNYIPGASMEVTISKSSELYDICVPLSAVRNDIQGSYVLIARTGNTMLGEELEAVRAAVNIIDKDTTTAAVEGTLNSDDEVIISSSKEVSEGDRVRLKD